MNAPKLVSAWADSHSESIVLPVHVAYRFTLGRAHRWRASQRETLEVVARLAETMDLLAAYAVRNLTQLQHALFLLVTGGIAACVRKNDITCYLASDVPFFRWGRSHS